MLHYAKFRQELLGPVPGREVYIKRRPGKGWPEHCPPIRAAQAFGFDLLANFNVTFTQTRGKWRATPQRVIESDFDWSADERSPGQPLMQEYAWFWMKGQKLPHVITDNVYRQIRNQVKISTYLFLATDPNELLLMTDVPNLPRPWRVVTALVDTDWYPASYPWHCVIELDASKKKIKIKKGEPLCRVVPVRRGAYFAEPMSAGEFDAFFERGQEWLAAHGKAPHGPAEAGTLDITGAYARQQLRSKFIVKE